MNVTNRYGLPASIEAALRGKEFRVSETAENVFWLTKLLMPPKVVQLERRHESEIEEDVADRVFRVLGTAMHAHIEGYNQTGERLTEEKAYVDIEEMQVHTLPVGAKLREQDWYSDDKMFLSLRLDCYDGTDQFVEDYKVTSVWGVIIDGKPKDEWVAQNNIAAYVIRKIGFPVKGRRNILILRDWSKSKVAQDANYPPIPIQVYQSEVMWTDEECEEYIRERIKVHVAAMTLNDDQIPHCDSEERWSKPTTFAVMKPGRKTALRVFPNEATAQAMAESNPGTYVETRPGEEVRCNGYCGVKNLCHFGRKWGA